MLPVETAIPDLLAALEAGRNAVLVAPPGAGKTTRVPPALAGAGWAGGRILVLEPRRIAARAAAERMAAERGETVGRSIGYRIRGETRPGSRIEVVTEGILTRMLQDRPDLPGVAAVVFDEIHERSIHSDLGLALALEVQAALRPDLRLVAMSATLEAERLAALMRAPVIASAGRSFPVETRWLDRPWDGRLEDGVAGLAARAAAEGEGDLLVFLPGAGEIRRTAERLARLAPGLDLVPLYGALPFAEQRRALEPGPRRRAVLASAIAETSLTVPGVRIVVDSGRARRSVTHAASGMARLVTVPVSRAEAAQRQGRAGREAPGVCWRLWTRGEHGALPEHAPPEIRTTDLAPLALELALWGGEPAFLDPPPGPAMAEARALLGLLGALDGAGRITAHGRAMAALPAHPRLAHMLLSAGDAGTEAALLAALIAERDPLVSAGRPSADLALRIRGVLGREEPVEPGASARIREEARRLARLAGASGRPSARRAVARAGALAALAYPDRVGQRRDGEAPRYLLSGGRGAVLAPGDPLGGAPLLVAVDVEDTRPEATIRRAAALDEADLRAALPAAWVEDVVWDSRRRQVTARRQERAGALVLREEPWREAPAPAFGPALIEGLRERGLRLPARARRLAERVEWLRAQGEADLPDWSEAALLATAEAWLGPWLAGVTRIEEVAGLDLEAALRAALAAAVGPERAAAVDRAAPEHVTTPLGRRVAIDYSGETPSISVPVQEMFGVTRHPEAAGRPLAVELLSPARRPVQVTQDLPGFWAGSYAEVRKEMRARYPRHPWPEDPAAAAPTARTKRRAP